jgi:VWFA-related protein
LVQVDVTVVDHSERPVPGLGVGDFSILDNGRPAVIEVVTEVKLPGPGLTADWMRSVSVDVVRNDSISKKRLVLIVVDDGRTSALKIETLRSILRGVIGQLGPDDLAAIVFTAANRGAQDWTHDRALLLDAVDTMQSGWGREDYPPIFEAYSVDVISRATRGLIGMQSHRKVLVYVGHGHHINVQPGGGSRRPGASRDVLGIGGRVDAIMRDAQKAGVAIFAVEPGLLPSPKSRDLQYLRKLSGFTGGFAVSGEAPDAPSQIARIFEQTGHYYSLGFRALDEARGGFRRLQVLVNRPGAIVRAQAGYYPPRLAAEPTPTEKTGEVVSQALAGILPVSDISMALALTPFGADTPGGEVGRVVANVRIGDGPFVAPEGHTAVPLDLEVRMFDGEGVREVARQRLQLARRSPVEGLLAVAIKPGRYNVRVAIHDRETGRSGSVYGTTTVPPFEQAGFSASGTFVRASHRQTVAILTDWPASLPKPTVERRFGSDEEFQAGTRVYASGPSLPVAARVQILDARDTVVRDEVRILDRQTLANRRWIDVLTDIGPRQLPPGEYLLQFAFSSGSTLIKRRLVFWIKN